MPGPTATCCIYARFSSDLQQERSIDDQVALCRAHAAREGLEVVATYADRARSGASVLGRDGLMELMAAARARQFDVVVVEALDRLSRDQEDLAGLYKRLAFLGIEIRAVHDGRADAVAIGVRGLVGALYLQDLAHKVRRGLAGVVRDGRHAGGRAYGYAAVPGRPGELVIVPHEAETVRRIFEAYAGGMSPRAIAAALNRDGVPAPRGPSWSAVTLNGNTKRRTGILQTDLYDGRIVWNRVRMVKDPDTGRRVSRPNPPAEWHEAEARHLRIVPPELWAAVQARKAGRAFGPVNRTRAPKHLLSGLLRCGACGGGMSVKDRRRRRGGAETVRVVCTRGAEGGTCPNRRPYDLGRIERTVTGSLRERLTDKPAIAHYVKTYNAERRRLAAAASASRGRLESDLARAQRELDHSIDQLISERISEAEADERLPRLRATRDRLRAELAGLDAPPRVITLHPGAIAAYLAAVERLDETIRAGGKEGKLEGSAASATALRELIESVTVIPGPPGDAPTLEIAGRLTRLIGGEAFPQARISGGGLMVAEARVIQSPPPPWLWRCALAA